MVKRYDCTHGNARYCYGCYTMEEAELGDWVKHDDYDALAARLAEAVAALHEIAHAHDAAARRLRLMAADALIRHNAADSADAVQQEDR